MSAPDAALAGRRILMTADALGGVWQYASDLSAELARQGCEVTLALLGPAPDAAQRAILHPGVRLRETGLPLDWMCQTPEEVHAAAQGIARLAGATRADLVHCNSPALIGAAGFRVPVPVVAAAHGCIATWWQAARGGPLDPALAWHGELVRAGLMRADAVVAPSAAFAATLEATYGLSRHVSVVHNGRPPTPSGKPGAPMHAVLTAGRMWDPVKNAGLVDRIAALTGMRLLAAGALEGPHGERAAFAHAVALGHVPGGDLAALLARRPVFLSAATFEPFGLAVLEAASAGCALVLSDIPTFRELWEGAALFADPQDAEGFAAAITRLDASPDLRAALGEASRMRSERLTPAACATGMAAIYRALLAPCEAAA